jgi:ribosomal protein L29
MNHSNKSITKQNLVNNSLPELQLLLTKFKEEAFKSRMDLRSNKLKDVHAVYKKRKEIARIKTVIREKELEGVKQ